MSLTQYKSQQTDSFYEYFEQKFDFQINYHFDRSRANSATHWHEHIELLCVTSGTLCVYIQGKIVTATPGDLIAINSGEIHTIHNEEKNVRYCCLIPHKTLCTYLAFPVETIYLKHLIHDSNACAAFLDILQDIRAATPFYKTRAQANLLLLLIYLAEHHSTTAAVFENHASVFKETLIRNAISYIQSNYLKKISTKDISNFLGANSTYLCRCFKEITGNTILEYLNILRCEHAKMLIISHRYSIAEVALNSGFPNFSYFSKTYKKFMGELPSETTKHCPAK